MIVKPSSKGIRGLFGRMRERSAPRSTLAVIAGADHFFGAQLGPLAERVVALVTAFRG